MAGHDHRRAILRLTNAGRLDEALSELAVADGAGTNVGVSVLVRLAHGLLEDGRQTEALSLLARATELSPFDPTLRRITTEVGHPVRRPSGEHEAVDGEARRTPTAPMTPPEMDDSPTVEVSRVSLDELAPTFDDGPTLEDRATLRGRRREADTTPMRAEQGPSSVDEVLEQSADTEIVTAPQPGSADTNEVRVPLRHRESDTHPLPRLPEGDGADTDKLSLPRNADLADTDQVALPEARGGDDFSTDRVSSAGDDAETELIEVPAAIDARSYDDSPTIEANAAAVRAAAEHSIPDTTQEDLPPEDATRPLDLGGVDMDAPTRHDERGPALPRPITTATRRIDLDEVEVVGFFQAGAAADNPMLAPPPEAEEPAVDFGRVPDSDTLRRRLEDQERPRRGGARGQPSPAPPEALQSPQPTGDPPPSPMHPAAMAPPVRRDDGTTARVELPPPRSVTAKRRRALVRISVAGVVTFTIGATIAFGWVLHGRRAETREVEEARALLADDTFASHREALATLARLSSRHEGGLACAEHAVEAVTMWGRFGLGSEHADTARRALATCDPDRDEGALALTRTLLLAYEGDPRESEQVARSALAVRPDDVRIRTALAIALERAGDLDQAATELGAARAAEPSYVPAALELARLHRRAGRRGEARLVLDDVRRFSPRHVEARVEELMLALDTAGGRPREPALTEIRSMASELETTAQGQPPAVLARTLVARGRLWLTQGNVDQAGQLLGQAIRLGTPSPDAAMYVARGLRLSGDLPGAIEVTAAARSDAPELRMERARALVAAGRPAAALRELAALREGAQDRATLARLEARARVQAGDAAAGAAVLTALVDASPDSRSHMALAEVQLGRGRAGQAQRILAKVSARPWAACAEARRLELRGQARRALGVLEDRGDPGAVCTNRAKSVIARRLGDTITEISSLRSALRDDPRFDDRLALIRAVWRERGSRAAEREAQSLVDAPPTGGASLLAAVDLLFDIGGHGHLEALIDRARAAGASERTLVTAAARFERRRGQPATALDRLGDVDDETSAAAILERGASLIALGRHGEALPILRRARPEEASALWVEAQVLVADALGAVEGRVAADRHLERSARTCADVGGSDGAQRLALRRVEMALEGGGSAAEARSLLRFVPAWPPTPQSAYLAGQIAESAGNDGNARRAYRLALEVDPAHVPSLTRLTELTGSHELRRRLRMLTPDEGGLTSPTGGGA